MNRRIVSWAKNPEGEKMLVAFRLLEETNEVEAFSFSESIVTEDFEKQLRHDWKSGKDILFPEHNKHIKKLSITEPLLPDTYKLEDQDFINRIRTEWTFVVLSYRLKSTFEEELAGIKSQVEQLTDYDKGIWNDLKSFWNKVQTQSREKNLFREHADLLRDNTNALFDQVKEIRNKANKQFSEESTKLKSGFLSTLDSIEKRVDDGLSLHPIFQELKDIQNKFKHTRMTKGDRDNVWDKLDGLFKKVKEKRFGADGSRTKNSSLDRVQRRLDGLLAAIDRMNRSIKRDEKDLKYEEGKSEFQGGQLESQLRSAKIDMIKQRIESKKLKYDDMLKTQAQLEKKIDKLKIKEEQDRAKAEIKDKIAQEIHEHHEHIMDNPKVAKAIEEVKESVHETPTKPRPETSKSSISPFDQLKITAANSGKVL